MAEYTAQDLSEERLKQAAEEFVRQGIDIRARVHDLTLAALQSRRFDRDAMRDFFRANTQGVASGADRGGPDMRQALADGLKGMDQALAQSAEAGATALKQIASTGRNFSESDLKAALASLKKLEDDFVSTVSGVADAASSRVQPELRGALGNLTHTGTETGKQLALSLNELTHRFALLSIDASIAGLEAASEFGRRFAHLASGILSGVADALQKPQQSSSDSPPKAS
jgi:hypothetical protein